MWRCHTSIAAVALVLLGCRPTTLYPTVTRAQVDAETEKQRELAIVERVAQQARVSAIGYPILGANAQLCGARVRYGAGMTFASPATFETGERDAARRALSLRDGYTIVAIVPRGAADRAGLQVGDEIMTLNGWSAPAPGSDRSSPVTVKLSELARSGAAIEVTVRRADARIVAVLTPDRICDYALQIERSEEVNAYADGRRIVVTTGMLRFAHSDIELATVIGHELAHNAMGHLDAQRGNAVIGLVIDILGALGGVDTGGRFAGMAAQAFSQEFEAEADYVGLYFARRAGFAIDDAPNFWRRMAVAFPGAIKNGGFFATHPATPERFLALEQTVREIKVKAANGAPLVPEKKR